MKGLFVVETFRPILLVSKLPKPVLRLFEALEKLMPMFLLEKISLGYTIALKKRPLEYDIRARNCICTEK